MDGNLREIFGLVDIGIGAMWLVILLMLMIYRKAKIAPQLQKYFTRMVLFKFLMAFVFMSYYVLIFKGGDNTSYWMGGVKLNKLFFANPSAFFSELLNFNKSEPRDILVYFNVGLPPGWIFREYEAWFVSRVTAVLSFITFRSYIATSLLITYIVAMASWRLFELVIRQNIVSVRNAALAILFIPSVGFWCSGISKDSMSFIAIIYWLVTLFNLFNGYKKVNFKSILILIVCAFVMINVRGLLFYVIIFTSALGLVAGYQKKLKNNFLFKVGYIGLLLIGTVMIVVLAANSSLVDTLNESEYLEEAEVQIGDFESNVETYGNSPRYNLGVSEFTVTGIIKVFPMAVITAFYRPFIYEALSVSLLLNGIESVVLLWFTLKFLFNGSLIRKIQLILSNEILSFALYFSILFGFIVGLTSIIFGVLVRLRAPILPFLALLLLSGAALYAKEQRELKENKDKAKQNT